MNRVKTLSIMLVFILVSQLIFSHLGFVSVASSEQLDSSNEHANKVEVNHLEHDESSITWQVTLGGSEDENVNIDIKLGSGLTHGTIADVSAVTIQENDDGYEVELPEADAEYTFEMITKINSEQAEYSVDAILTNANGTFTDSDKITISKAEAAETEIEDTKEADKKEKQEEETKNEEESTTENNNKTDKKQASKESDETVEDESHEFDLSKLDPYSGGSNFLSYRTFSTSSGENITVNKQAKAVTNGDFTEWEIELTVKGEVDQGSSDIVMLIDTSGSMNECVSGSGQNCVSRMKATKAAAKEFVQEVFANGGTSKTRIALVEFNTTATKKVDLTNNQSELIGAINNLSASGGTNIHHGLYVANNQLSNSTATQQTIVLMGDGEPTYSQKANDSEQAPPGSWPTNDYEVILKDFNYNNNGRVGSGNSTQLPTGFLGIGDKRYRAPNTLFGYRVEDNILPTISEARWIMDSGVGIYSIGVDVGHSAEAEFTLEHSQNKGFYSVEAGDLSAIYSEIAVGLLSPGSDAIVTDPLGDMFDLVESGSYSGNANWETSHDKAVTWDAGTETFKWNIDNIQQGETFTFKYKVNLDCTENPQVNTKYPTNKTTTLNYKDHNGTSTSKNFPIPEVKVDTGQITKIGYRVNSDGDPVDSSGAVVADIADAEQFYNKLHASNLATGETYDVPAEEVDNGYVLHGDFTDPAQVKLTTNFCNVANFGYVQTGKFELVKVDEDNSDNYLAGAVFDVKVPNGEVVDQVTTGQDGKVISKALPEGEYTLEEVTAPTGYEISPNQDLAVTVSADKVNQIIVTNKQGSGQIKIIKTDKDNNSILLEGAEFVVKSSDGTVVTTLETDANGEVTSDPLLAGQYTLEETTAPTGYELSTTDLTVTVVGGQVTEKVIENKKQLGSITITKIDADDEATLADAKFEIYNSDNEIVGVAKMTDSNGKVVFVGLEWGDYTITETKAPQGYRILEKETSVTIDANNLDINEVIENTKQGWQIPDTGGIGTLGFYGIGIVLMTLSLLLIFRRRHVL